MRAWAAVRALGGSAGVGGGAGTNGMTCDGFRIPEDHPNVARDYDTTTAGVVSDAVTGLMWERAFSPTFPPPNCATRTLAGLSGWRLPGLLELESIADLGVLNPAISAISFPNTPTTWFTSSTGVYLDGRPVGGSMNGWTTDFRNGSTMNGTPPDVYFRCVRTAAPPLCHPAGARFTPSPSAVVMSVLDATTMLTWQKDVGPEAVSWQDAKTYCASLGGGFRLPGVKELLSLVDFTAATTPIDLSAFPGTPRDLFWTSSAVAGTAAFAWTVDFTSATYARAYPIDATELRRVRCVRSM